MAFERVVVPGAWTVTKQQVVAGHLSRALDLFVLEDDPLSAHLLCGAARDIAHELAKGAGKEKVWDCVVDHIKDEYQRAFFGLLKDEYNFLKHADPNRENLMTHYTPEITSLFLWETCLNVEILLGERYAETTLFQVYYMSWHPGMANDDYAASLDSIRANSRDLYDVHGRMKWESLQQAFKLFRAKRAGSASFAMPYLADQRAGPPQGVEGI